ncbi:serine/threonine protein kinase [Mycobacterium szulgai]|uniref:serine/threonine protein kinase n=1 Tax=Mycobacterium szulgai TaxID=1787 RepID=UPI0035584C9F
MHRDVKPANVLLTEPDGQPRRVFLADFGIARRIAEVARLTSTNMAVGTAAYAAPEQLMGAALDGRADQYALACTAFHLLCGARPYDSANLAVVISQQITAEPPSIGARRPDLAALDPVFATAMAKKPSDRFDSCQEFAHQLSQCLSGAAPYTFATRPAPAVQVRRSRVRIGVLAAAVVLLLAAAAVFGGLQLTAQHHPGVAAGPLSGVYRADFGPITGLDDVADTAAAPELVSSYGLRSVCGTTGCVATATRLSGAPVGATTMVFDQIDGRWVAVALGSDLCRSMPSEFWQVFTLQPGPGGSLTGEYSTTAGNGCAEKRTVTFTRTDDPDDNRLPDPAGQPKRVSSPAEALHGRYRLARTFTSGMAPQRTEAAVRTDCLRTGQRCISYFHGPSAEFPLVFDGTNWTSDIEQDTQCPGTRATTHVKTTEQYSLPAPPQNPITLLSGQGHQVQSEPCALDSDFGETFTRTGD